MPNLISPSYFSTFFLSITCALRSFILSLPQVLFTMFLSRAIVLVSFVLYAHVLATPHVARPLHHRGIAARLVAPIEDQPIQPRRLSKRCKPRPSISQSSSSVPHTTAPYTSSKEQPTPTSAPHTTYTPPPPPTTTQAHTTAAPPKPTTSKAAPPATTSSSGSGGNEPSFMFGLQTGQGALRSCIP